MEFRSEESKWKKYVAASVVAAALLLPCGNSAAATTAPDFWEAPIPLASVVSQSQVEVASAPDGSATSVWVQSLGPTTALMSADRPAGSGSWSEPEVVGGLSSVSVFGGAVEWGGPRIDIGADGTAAITWISGSTSASAAAKIQVSIRPPGGDFSAPETVPTTNTSTSYALSPNIAVGPDGKVAVVWERNSVTGPGFPPAPPPTRNSVQASLRPGGGQFGPVQTLTLPGESEFGGPDVAIANDGTTTAVWGAGGVRVASAAPGADFSAPETLEPTTHLFEPRIEASADGSTTIAWPKNGVMVSRRPQGGSFETPVNISPGQGADWLSFDVADDGTVFAAFNSIIDGIYTVNVASRTAGGTITPPEKISGAGDATFPKLGVSGDGRVTVTWRAPAVAGGSNTAIYYATRPPAGSFTGSVLLTKKAIQTGTDPAPASGTTIVWVEQVSNDDAVTMATSLTDEGTFGSGVRLSPVSRITGPEIAAGPEGDTLAAWSSSSVNGEVIQIRSGSGGTYSKLIAQQPGISANSLYSNNPSVAAGPDHRLAIAWQTSETADGPHRIQVATRSSTGPFSVAKDISDPGRDSTDPQVAIGADGTAAVVWKDRVPDSGSWRVMLATADEGWSLSKPGMVATGLSSEGKPQVAVTTDGKVITTWSGSDGVVRASIGAPSSSPVNAVQLSGPAGVSTVPRVSAGPEGSAAITWKNVLNGTTRIFIATRDPKGGFRPAARVKGQARDQNEPQITMGPGGRATVIWVQGAAAGARVVATTESGAGEFVSPYVLSESEPSLAVPTDVSTGTNGTTTVVWQQGDGDKPRIYSATREPSKSFSKPSRIISPYIPEGDTFYPDDNRMAKVAVSPDGSATAVWQTSRASLTWGFTQTRDVSKCRTNFILKRVSKNHRRGTASLRFKVNAPGKIFVIGSRKLRSLSKRVSGKQVEQVSLVPRGAAKKALRRNGRTKVRVKLSFLPRGACGAVQRSRTVALVKRR